MPEGFTISFPSGNGVYQIETEPGVYTYTTLTPQDTAGDYVTWETNVPEIQYHPEVDDDLGDEDDDEYNDDMPESIEPTTILPMVQNFYFHDVVNPPLISGWSTQPTLPPPPPPLLIQEPMPIPWTSATFSQMVTTEEFSYWWGASGLNNASNFGGQTSSIIIIQFNEYRYQEWLKKSQGENKDMAQKDWADKKVTQLVSRASIPKLGLFGLEIECEGKNLPGIILKYWSAKQDNSLREYKGHPPFEYVFREPLSEEDTRLALKYLASKMKDEGSDLVFSSRCSVHVHVNIQDLTLKQLYQFIIMYIIFEELLVDYVGSERAGNLFCLRAKDSDFLIQMLENPLKTEHFKMWKEDYRYSACNLASVTKFGSLEFRSMKGNLNSDFIFSWCQLLKFLKDKSQVFKTPAEIIEIFLRIGPLPFFKKIFGGTEFEAIFRQVPDLSSKLWTGCRLVRDVAYAYEWKVTKEVKEVKEVKDKITRKKPIKETPYSIG